MDRLGIYDDLVRRRECILAFAPQSARNRILQQKPSPVASKVHRITVDLRTGERTVESDIVVAVPPAPPAPKRSPFRPAIVPTMPCEFHRIVDAVALAFAVERNGLFTKARSYEYAHARFACWRLIQQYLDWSQPRIGRAFGGRDHTTVLAGLRRAGEMLESDATWREKYLAAVAELVRS